MPPCVAPLSRGPAPVHRVVAIAALIAVAACGPKSEPQEEPELIEHRVEACQTFCAAYVDPTCTEWTRTLELDMDGCVTECATWRGELASGWGYQKSAEADACISEWKTMHAECFVGLSCEDRALFYSEEYALLPRDEQPCGDEVYAMLSCAVAHPCCEGQGEDCSC